MKKILNGFKKFIDENIKELILLLSFYILMTNPLPYYIFTSGGTTDVADHIEIKDSYDSKGSFSLAYVNQLQATLPTYLLEKIIPSWDIYSLEDMTYTENEDNSTLKYRDLIDLLESQQAAVKNAYLKAGKTFNIKEEKYYIYYISNEIVDNNENIKIGDQLLKIDGNKIDKTEYVREYVETKEVGDTVTLTLKRDKKEINSVLTVKQDANNKDRKIIGVMISRIYDYETDPKIKFTFKNSEGGSSGGLTMALAIYNKLTKDDLTKGLKVVGTGTIDSDGNVGEIGGVKYKLSGAVKDKADVFIVPDGNYTEAMKEKKKNNYKIKIISVKTFDEAIDKLNDIE